MSHTIYEIATGRVVNRLTLFDPADIALNHDPATEAVAEGDHDGDAWYFPGGARTARPSLAPLTASAPYLLDLGTVVGPTLIADELGTVLEAPGGETVELPAGTYTITPPFPWRRQVIEVTA